MHEGTPSKGIEFFNLLNESDEFCMELGKVTLAAGKLEATLIESLEKKDINESLERATLGRLIKIAKHAEYIDNNLSLALESVCQQRNYLTHNIYALFSGLIEETILEKEDLLDSDVQLFIERAWQLQDNLNNLAKIARKEIESVI